jgi:RNA polymerase sigma-70 factor (ECF subfamily)
VAGRRAASPRAATGVDAGLVARAAAGDQAAVATLAERALRLALRTAAAVTGSREEAGDVAQDVAIEVLRGIGRLRDPASFDAWVHRITVRRALRTARRRRARHGAEVPISDIPEAREAVPEDDPADRVQGMAAAEAVRDALAELPARQRAAVALRYGHDLSEREVAAAIGCRPGTAAALLSRGRAALRGSPRLAALAGEEGGRR